VRTLAQVTQMIAAGELHLLNYPDGLYQKVLKNDENIDVRT
jgi:hypothetical protein